MAEESSNEYTPLDLSMKGKATSTSRDGTQDDLSTLGAYNTICDEALSYQRNTLHTLMTDEICNVDGVTDNGSTRYQPMGSIKSVDNTRPSTSRAGIEAASVNSGDGTTNAPGTGRKEQRELCAVCGNVSNRRHALHGHAKKHADDTAHICKACDQSSVKKSKIVEHSRNRTNKKHKCETCGKQFRQANHLTEHYRTHTDERPYKCETCGKQFHRAHHLDNHKRTHTDERPYKCQICNKSFRRSTHLDDHKRTHTDDRLYKCQVCNKSFRRSTHLDDHKRTHSYERPYKCEVCNKSFRRSTHRDVHQLTHTDERPYKCEEICGS
nr:zinc finger protein 724-like [Dermacentor andersoni]